MRVFIMYEVTKILFPFGERISNNKKFAIKDKESHALQYEPRMQIAFAE